MFCSTICVPSATRHDIHIYRYFFFAAIHHLKSSPTFSVRPCSSVGRVTVDLIRRSWVSFPPRSKDFFFASCGSLFPFTRAKQATVAKSSTEAEYVALSSAKQEAVWLRRLMEDLGRQMDAPTTIYEDDQGAIELAKNAKYHNRTKHIDRVDHGLSILVVC